jgi:hypothetical protein
MAPSILDVSIERLRASITEGRPESVRFRQNEFQRLHAALRENSASICDAISKEESCSIADAEKEFYLTMDALRTFYETLDFDQLLKQEYLVKEGKDNRNRRVGLGLVAIRPSSHSQFYSVLVPLSAAIAAGNCVILEVSFFAKTKQDRNGLLLTLDQLTNSLSAVGAALLNYLPSALDQDTFFITPNKLQLSQLSKTDLFVNQTSQNADFSISQLTSSSQSTPIAIIDRTADINVAAKAIITARLVPHWTSPYSPELVIVNAFILDAFKTACLKYTDDLSNLTIRTCSSITDAITSQKESPVFLATYLFAAPSVSKFLSEQLPSQVSYINQIPLCLLYGPASPSSLPPSQHPRYTPEMFSVSRPQIVSKEPEIPNKVDVLREFATKKLKETGQKPGYAVGFFEQGIFIGLGVTALVVLPAVGWGMWTVGRQAWKYAAARGKLM